MTAPRGSCEIENESRDNIDVVDVATACQRKQA
jgi:hypothetical protein